MTLGKYKQFFTAVLVAHNVELNAAEKICQVYCVVLLHKASTPSVLPAVRQGHFFCLPNQKLLGKFRTRHRIKFFVHTDDPKHVITMPVGYSPLLKGSGVYVDLNRNLIFYINNGQLSEILIDSLRLQLNRSESVGIGS